MKAPSHYHNENNIPKAFVLGCDPTAYGKDGIQREFQYVFGIKKDKRYFSGINANLIQLDLDQECVYIQNLITQPQKYETAKNPLWKEEALKNIQARKAEFDSIDPSGKLPVFLTSKLLYDVLLNDDETNCSAKELYELKTTVPIPPNKNKLNRPLIPLFRHQDYALSNPNQKKYNAHLNNYIKLNSNK